MARMVGRTGIFACGCCHQNTARKERRSLKRKERNAWKREVSQNN
jgi:hypothetical protein